MSGDHSRDSFNALRDFAGVFLQQGRPVLDSDWNEMVEIFERRIRAGTVDTIGRAVVPRETILGFHIRPNGAGSIEIGRGRLYLDGMLAECHGAANFPGSDDTDLDAPVHDRSRSDTDGPEGVLDELIPPATGDYLDYEDQPYWAIPDALPGTGGAHLVYLVAWQREVTALQMPELLDPALNGVDTTTRWQTVWQVRVLPGVGMGATCDTPDGQLNGWVNTIAPSTARLTTGTQEVDTPENPCLVPPTDGYSGLENQLYRVQIHSVGQTQSDARFKFSRENASVAAAIESFASPADRITVRRIGRDEILRFRPGDWVEITDDRREFNHVSGQMLQVDIVHEDTREIELRGTVDADLIPTGADGDTAEARHSRLIRWDQKGVIRRSDGSEYHNLDVVGSDGLIPVPPPGTVLVLESGITVEFATAPGDGHWREMDAWRFSARTANTDIDILTEAPPETVQRHYTRLAILDANTPPRDCREFWPPDFGTGSESCGCTVCVTAEGHNSGQGTIQDAIDDIEATGGTICLDGGFYTLSQPLDIRAKVALTLRGQGMATVLSYQGAGSAIDIRAGLDVQIERLSLLVRAEDPATGAAADPVHGIGVTNTTFLALRRLAVVVLSEGAEREDHGIHVEGVLIASKIEECMVMAPVGIGSVSALDSDAGEPGYIGLADLRAEDNIVFGARAAVRFGGIALNIAAVTWSRSIFFGQDNGLILNWFSGPTAATLIEGNLIISNGDALVSGVNDLLVQDNDITGGPENGNGVRLIRNFASAFQTSAQIIGNRISDLSGAGLYIAGNHAALLIKRNMIRRCGTAGILTDAKADVRHIAIDNNVIEAITGASAELGTAGIMLTRVLEGQVLGNSIRAIGQQGGAGTLTAGIAAQGVGALAVEQNTLYEIGPASPEARTAAILVRPPFLNLSVQSNRIVGTPVVIDEQRDWMAIDIGPDFRRGDTDVVVGDEREVVGHAAGLPAVRDDNLGFVEINGGLLTFSVTNAVFLPQWPDAQVLVQSNQIRHLAPLVQPVVSLFDGTASAMNFSHNQCQIDLSNIFAVISVGAPRIIAGNNAIRHRGDTQSMVLNIASGGAATPIGNITSSGIDVQPGGLNPPFDTLNVISG